MTVLSALLVDDSRSARLFMKSLLESSEVEVAVAESGAEALSWLKDNRPDVVFMDHVMADMDGVETMQRMKGHPFLQDIPVVMCTSTDDEGFVRRVSDLGAMAVLPKPPTPSKLSGLLDELKNVKENLQQAVETTVAAEAVNDVSLPWPVESASEPESLPEVDISIVESPAFQEPVVPPLPQAISTDDISAVVEQKLESQFQAHADGLVRKLESRFQAYADDLVRDLEDRIPGIVRRELATNFLAFEAYLSDKAADVSMPPIDEWRTAFFSDKGVQGLLRSAAQGAAEEAVNHALLDFRHQDLESQIQTRIQEGLELKEAELRREIADSARDINQRVATTAAIVALIAAVVGVVAAVLL